MEEVIINSGIEVGEAVKEIEVWKDILNYLGYYQISSHGRIMSKSRLTGGKHKRLTDDIIMRLSPNTTGYLRTSFTKDGAHIQAEAHRLVGIHFVPNPENKPCINHLDGNKLNNYYKNLQWCTWGENNIHALNTGLRPGTFGERNKSSKLTEDQVIEIRALKNSMSYSEISEMFNVHSRTVQKIISNEIWATDKSFKRIKVA